MHIIIRLPGSASLIMLRWLHKLHLMNLMGLREFVFSIGTFIMEMELSQCFTKTIDFFMYLYIEVIS